MLHKLSIKTKYNYDKLERAVHGAPSQIPTLKFLIPQYPQVPPLCAMTQATEWKFCSICSISFIYENTKFGVKIFEIDFVIEI